MRTKYLQEDLELLASELNKYMPIMYSSADKRIMTMAYKPGKYA